MSATHDAEEWNHPVDRPTYRFVVDDVDALSQNSTRFPMGMAFNSIARCGGHEWSSRDQAQA